LPASFWGNGVLEKDILIVDDEPGVCELLGGALQDAGYDVELAATAAEATKLLHERRYRMVIVDWRLPDGDGATIANLAAATGSHAFVMSGYLRQMLPGNVDPRQALMKPSCPPNCWPWHAPALAKPQYDKELA
jgi:hypothetical protein